jgi:hypothetical protein
MIRKRLRGVLPNITGTSRAAESLFCIRDQLRSSFLVSEEGMATFLSFVHTFSRSRFSVSITCSPDKFVMERRGARHPGASHTHARTDPRFTARIRMSMDAYPRCFPFPTMYRAFCSPYGLL